MDGMTRMMQQWNSSSEFSSVEKAPRRVLDSPCPPPPNHTHTNLTAQEYAFLKLRALLKIVLDGRRATDTRMLDLAR
jgi:hypothetical protein